MVCVSTRELPQQAGSGSGRLYAVHRSIKHKVKIRESEVIKEGKLLSAAFGPVSRQKEEGCSMDIHKLLLPFRSLPRGL